MAELCTPIPHPDCDLDWISDALRSRPSFQRWLKLDPDLTVAELGAVELIADLLPPLSHKPQVRERVSMFKRGWAPPATS